jgi:signal transduction histidine kinase
MHPPGWMRPHRPATLTVWAGRTSGGSQCIAGATTLRGMRATTSRPISRLASSGSGLSVAVATAALLAALLLASTLAPSTWSSLLPGGPSLPAGAGIAGVGLLIVGAGVIALRVSEAGATLLLALACMTAGLAARAVSRIAAPDGAAPDPWLWAVATLLADAGMFWISALVATAWAAAPRRSLGGWVAPLGVGLALVAVVGSIVRTWVTVDQPAAAVSAVSDAVSSAGGPVLPDLSLRLPELWRSGITIVAPLVIGMTGALRADGLRYLAGARPDRPRAAEEGSTWGFRVALATTLGAWALTVGFGEAGPRFGSVLPSLLWLLIAVVAVRWSRFAAWAALAASLVLSAEPALRLAETRALATVTPALPLGDPTVDPLWWLSIVVGWAIASVAIAAGWRSLCSVMRGRASARPALLALAVSLAVAIVAIATGRAIFATYLLWAPPAGWPIPDTWTPFVVLGPVAVGVAVITWRRLVPGVAEAEATVGDRFAPSEYLPIVAAEALTGRARVRAEVELAERARLASDLHADVLPALSQAVAASAAGAPSDRLAESLREVEAEVRGLLAERRLAVLDELGVVEALEWLAERTEERGGPPVTLDVDDGSTDERPPRPVERAGFRIAQLAVENAVRHARASAIRLEVLVCADRLGLRISDDGVGLPLPAGPGTMRADHFGLADMRAQADAVAARLEVTAGGERGTTVAFHWAAS